MEQITPGSILEHSIRFTIIMTGIGFAIFLGKFRPEWRSRKTLICWVWTMVAVDIMIMNGKFSESLSAQLFIGGALMLNVINFIGDRIETIKFKDFSASLKAETAERPEPTPAPPKKEPIQYVIDDPSNWPDGETDENDPGPAPKLFVKPQYKKKKEK